MFAFKNLVERYFRGKSVTPNASVHPVLRQVEHYNFRNKHTEFTAFDDRSKGPDCKVPL